MDQARKNELTAETLLMAVVLIWAVNFPVAKYGIRGLDIFVFNGIRYVVATAALGLIFVKRFRWTPVAHEDRAGLWKAGIVAHIFYQLGFIVGLKWTTAGNAAVLISTSPLWTLLWNARLTREKISRRMATGMFVSFCGVVMIIIGSGKKLEFGSNALFGDLVSLAAAAFWGLSTNLQKPLVAKYSAVQVSLIMIAIGALGLTLISVPSAMELAWSETSWTYFAAAIGSGALSTGAANVFWSVGVKRLGPGRTAVFNNLVPVFAFIISYFTLDERVYLIHFIGAGVTIAGVWVARSVGRPVAPIAAE